MKSVDAMTLDELIAAERELGRRWGAAYAARDLDRLDDVMAGIRIISAEIARRVTE